MPTPHTVPMRCKDCDHLFFESRLPVAGPFPEQKRSGMDVLKALLGRVSCPKCGSKNVGRDLSVRT